MPRYIDADMLTTWFEADSRGDYFGGDYVRGIIAETPTADVRENVRGEWVRITNYLAKCPVCEDYIDNAISCGYNYCPNCGAELSI